MSIYFLGTSIYLNRASVKCMLGVVNFLRQKRPPHVTKLVLPFKFENLNAFINCFIGFWKYIMVIEIKDLLGLVT
jgi:hypothetical protein